MTAWGWPSPTRAWYVAGLLCLIAALSYLDRYIIALLADPIIKDMGIDATAIGLLIGLGFGLLYALSGVPVAYLIDRGTRVRIVGIGVIVWSLSTVASGFAPNFEMSWASTCRANFRYPSTAAFACRKKSAWL